MILNKFIQFISQAKIHIFWIHHQFCAFRKHFACFATLLNAQDTSKLTEKETLVDASHKAVEKAWMINIT